MNIKPTFGNNTPIIGQQHVPMIQALALVRPELIKKMEAWCDKTGLPMNEMQNTIFRMGLIMFSVSANEPAISAEQATDLIPLTDNEEKAIRTDG